MERVSLCPYCRTRPSSDDDSFRPFCSERCKIADLGSWASGTYSISGGRPDIDDESAEFPAGLPIEGQSDDD